MAEERVSRLGTARALVLLGSGVQLAATAIGCFVALTFGPLLEQRPVVLAVVVFVAITLIDIALANLLALRAARTRGAVLGGCGTLLAGTVVGIAALWLIILS